MSILDGLQHHWKLEENVAPRVDSHGSETLSSAGGVGVASAVGKIDSAADFTRSDYLVAANETAVAQFEDDSFTICFWINFDSAQSGSDFPFPLGKNNTSTTERQFLFSYDGNVDRLRWRVRQADDSANTILDSEELGSPSVGTWYFVQLKHDADNDVVGIRVNDLPWDEATHTGGMPLSTARFSIGKRDGEATSFEAGRMNGKMDEVSIFGKVKTDAELDHIYNGGDGRSFPWPELAGAQGTDGSLRAGGTGRIISTPFLSVF